MSERKTFKHMKDSDISFRIPWIKLNCDQFTQNNKVKPFSNDILIGSLKNYQKNIS